LLFFLAGVPYAMVLAAIGGTLEFIPVVGPLAGGVIVVSVALFTGYPHPWLLAGFVLGWRLVQDYVSSPQIMGRGIEVHPALVIFGVIAGGEIGGPAGMFLSVPVIAALRVIWRRVRTLRQTPAPAPRQRGERREHIGGGPGGPRPKHPGTRSAPPSPRRPLETPASRSTDERGRDRPFPHA